MFGPDYLGKRNIPMLKDFLTSRRVRLVLGVVAILSAVLAVVSFVIPLNRKNAAIRSEGEDTIHQSDPVVLALEYYRHQDLASLVKYPSDGRAYRDLCSFLRQYKERYGYDRVYMLYLGVGGRLAYLADADYDPEAQEDTYSAVTTAYDLEKYNGRCQSILREVFDGKRQQTYVPAILEGGVITSYLPVTDESGQVLAVLGVDSILTYNDFTRYGFVNFESLTTISGMVFLISIILLVAGSVAVAETQPRRREPRRMLRQPKAEKPKEQKIQVDKLEDVNPEDYL